MAGYHYQLQIIPQSFTSIIDGDDFWGAEQPSESMLASFRNLLPKNTSWGETEEYRSDNNYSVLYIWRENQSVVSVQFEYAPIDQGEDNLLNDVLTLCNRYGYLLYSEESKSIIAPNKTDLWEDFKKHSRYKIYAHRIDSFH